MSPSPSTPCSLCEGPPHPEAKRRCADVITWNDLGCCFNCRQHRPTEPPGLPPHRANAGSARLRDRTATSVRFAACRFIRVRRTNTLTVLWLIASSCVMIFSACPDAGTPKPRSRAASAVGSDLSQARRLVAIRPILHELDYGADRRNCTTRVECAPGTGQVQAAVLTVCRVWWSSNWAGLR
jgi:hypothetical protein